MPAMTPVLARGPPSSLARMRFRLGPITFRSTPMNWTLNSSIRSPSKTVWPIPIIPGRISSTDMRVGDADTVRIDNAASATPRTAGRQRMGKSPGNCQFVVVDAALIITGRRVPGPTEGSLLALTARLHALVAFIELLHTVTSTLSTAPATVLTSGDLRRPVVSGFGAYAGWWWFTGHSEGAPLG